MSSQDPKVFVDPSNASFGTNRPGLAPPAVLGQLGLVPSIPDTPQRDANLRHIFDQTPLPEAEVPKAPEPVSPRRYADSTLVFETAHVSRVTDEQQEQEDGLVEDLNEEADSVRCESPAAMDTPAFSVTFAPQAEATLEKGTQEEEKLLCRLREVPHLHTLPQAQLRYIVSKMEVHSLDEDTEIIPAGGAVAHFYIVLSGTVSVYGYHVDMPTGAKRHQGPHVRRDTLTPLVSADVPEADRRQLWTLHKGDCFAFDCMILKERSMYAYVARTDARANGQRKPAIIGMLPHQDFFNVVRMSHALAQSIARKMCEDMETFTAFKDYARSVFAPTLKVNSNTLNFEKVLDKFGRIDSGIYPSMHSDTIDAGAWMYALRRLPDNITSTVALELAKAPPAILVGTYHRLASAADLQGSGRATEGERRVKTTTRFVPTKVRRRFTFETANKTIVLLRDSTTDLLDFVSCLCVHFVESRKLRNRLLYHGDQNVMEVLMEAMDGELDATTTQAALEQLPFSDKERAGLCSIWKDDTVQAIHDIVTRREEDFLVRIDLHSTRRFYRTPSHNWAIQIRSTVLDLLGLPATDDLPHNLVIDVLSSNAHGVKNCFSGFPRKYRADILKFARASRPEVASKPWHNEEDLVYYMAPAFLQQAGPEVKDAFNECRTANGVATVEDTSMTGIEVDVVNVGRLDPDLCDPILRDSIRAAHQALEAARRNPANPEHLSPPAHIIINTDFPFGAQAEAISKALNLIFGKRIRSFNVTGKAGGLKGARGDLQLATHVLFSKSALPHDDWVDETRRVGNDDVDPARIEALLGPGRSLHRGTVVTIAGTMMQNRKLLRYYRKLWHCVGVEMEGSYFARAVHEAVEQGVVRHDIKSRFVYYTSDLPLATAEESLALSLGPHEGVPPVYAVTRGLLELMIAPSDGYGMPRAQSLAGPSVLDGDAM